MDGGDTLRSSGLVGIDWACPVGVLAMVKGSWKLRVMIPFWQLTYPSFVMSLEERAREEPMEDKPLPRVRLLSRDNDASLI